MVVCTSVNIPTMSQPRFYCDQPLVATPRFELPERVAHHARVRRLKPGDGIVLFDGLGHEAQATITVLDRKHGEVSLDEAQPIGRERAGEITLVQGLASQDRMDWVIEKAVEIGVHRLIPVQAARSVAKLNAERSDKRLTHWHRIAQSASEQCGRNLLMQVQPVCTLQEALEQLQADPKLVCDTDEKAQPLLSGLWLEKIHQARKFCLFVGPEGGWDQSETERLKATQAICVSLGPRILRTETAGIAAIASLSTLLQW